MATDIIWKTPTVSYVKLMDIVNSLADDTTDDDGQTAINNESDLATHMDIEIELGSVDLSASTAPAIWVYLIESVDGGTDFDDYTDATATEGLMPRFDKLCAIIEVREGSGAETKTAIKSMIPIPPARFKLVVRNKCGAALGSTNTLYYRTYNLNNV